MYHKHILSLKNINFIFRRETLTKSPKLKTGTSGKRFQLKINEFTPENRQASLTKLVFKSQDVLK